MDNVFLSAFLVLNGLYVFYLCFPLLNTLVGFLLQEKKESAGTEAAVDFGIVITSYKDVEITKPLITSLLNQNYPNFHIYLVADHSDEQTGFTDDPRVTMIVPRPFLHSKVKSILLAINSFRRPHPYTLVFDPDNLAAPNLLAELNLYCSAGFSAVQGRRAAKNLDTRYACLDALGEHYYNHTQRYVPFLLGSSAPIAGSGMVVDSALYRSILDEIERDHREGRVIVAEDKMLQNRIVQKGLRIAYARSAVIYDEKIDTGQQQERQRTRWLNSYFKHFVESVRMIVIGLIRFDWNRFYFGLIVSIPPMVVLFLAGVCFLAADVFLSPGFFIATMVAGLLFALNFVLVLVAVQAEKQIWSALFGLPAFVLNQLLALLRIRRANKDFLVTTKTRVISIEDVLAQRKKENGGEGNNKNS